jgi:hypothetical protein
MKAALKKFPLKFPGGSTNARQDPNHLNFAKDYRANPILVFILTYRFIWILNVSFHSTENGSGNKKPGQGQGERCGSDLRNYLRGKTDRTRQNEFDGEFAGRSPFAPFNQTILFGNAIDGEFELSWNFRDGKDDQSSA